MRATARLIHPGIAHGALLPSALVACVPPSEKLVLNFVLSYLEAEALPAQLLINGGYVRDLLLGKTPDDLDLSLCLRDCPPEVTIDGVLKGLSAFAHCQPNLNVSSVNVTTILSDTSKDKNVDTAKAHLLVGSPAERIEVDFMPTIGEERYDEHDRVPLRDVRGTPEQDALRRDLTIGAMLLQISRGDAPAGTDCPVSSSTRAESAGFESSGAGMEPAGATGPTTALAAAEALQWRLLDFYGGISDLCAGVLRSPYPVGQPLAAVWNDVMRTPDDDRAARLLGLSSTPVGGAERAGGILSAVALLPVDGAAATEVNPVARTLQVIWWIKVLRDDPLRVLRALRFAAKLSFALHPTFWDAVPFALSPLQSKVAGSRKGTELLKIAKAGRAPLLDFLRLAFGRLLPNISAGPPEVTVGSTGGTALSTATMAPALFGGTDPKGEARLLDAPCGFDVDRMRCAVAVLPPSGLSDDEVLGTALAAAACACELPWGQPAAASAAELSAEEGRLRAAPLGDGATLPTEEGTDAAVGGAAIDLAAAKVAEAALAQVSAACDGLCASNELRAGAETALYCAASLLQPKAPLGVHRLFAEAAGLCPEGATGDASSAAVAEFAALVHMWDVLKMEKVLQGKAAAGYRPHFAVALAGMRCSDKTRERLAARLELLMVPGVAINGKALVGMPRLPSHLRGLVISQLHVLARLRGDELELSLPEQLQAYLGRVSCGGLLAKLLAEWYEDDGALRTAYAAPGKQQKAAAGASKNGRARDRNASESP